MLLAGNECFPREVREMKVGDVLYLVPTLSEKIGLESKGTMPCRVVYIHPQGRF